VAAESRRHARRSVIDVAPNYAPRMRNLDVIESELRLLAAVRRAWGGSTNCSTNGCYDTMPAMRRR
jgi:hypothetical protein